MKSFLKIVRAQTGIIEVYFDVRSDAEALLMALKRYILRFDRVSVFDLYNILSEKQDLPYDHIIGWKDLTDAYVCGVFQYSKTGIFTGQAFTLRLPKQVSIMYDPSSYRPDILNKTFHIPTVDEIHAIPVAWTNIRESVIALPKKKITTMTLKDVEELSKSGEAFQLRYEPEDPSSIWKTFKIYNGEFLWKNPRGIYEKGEQPLSVIFEADFRRITMRPLLKRKLKLEYPANLKLDPSSLNFRIICAIEKDAEEICRCVHELYAQGGVVSVSDLHAMLGEGSREATNHIGWDNLSGLHLRKDCASGNWIVYFPRTTFL